MMEQYWSLKNSLPKDTLLLFRLGDFYEMFYDDAILASKELELTLTGRDCGQEERAPMCGVPFHSADSYIAKLVSRGYKVAICEQMEDPALAKGIVKREVIRIITPGTVIEGNMLEDGVNNYLCSVFGSENGAGLCFADVSTGEFHVTLATGEDVESKVINQLSTYSPKEVIFGGTAGDMPRHPSQLYEAFLEGIVLFCILQVLSRKKPLLPQGTFMGVFVMGYGIVRFLIEFVRVPDAQLGYLLGGVITMGQLLSLPLVIAGLALIIFALRRDRPQRIYLDA